MYKAIHAQTKAEIIILSPEWENQLDQLRLMDKSDQLVCQGCQQPVRVRAGKVKRPHFAHKHLLSCSYGTKSPEILAARAVLYRWLITKFTTGVTLEKDFEDVGLPRPVDCYVEWKNSKFAYWIIDAGLKSQTRENIDDSFSKLNIPVTWAFVADMLTPAPENDKNILLSPTEREFLRQSEYDEITSGENRFGSRFGTTIHYLDSNSGTNTYNLPIS